MMGIGKDRDRSQENRLNLSNANAVFAAFFAVAVVPIEARHDEAHKANMSIVHTFVNCKIPHHGRCGADRGARGGEGGLILGVFAALENFAMASAKAAGLTGLRK